MTRTARYLKDYSPYPFTIATIDLRVELDPQQTRVFSSLVIQRNPQAEDPQAALELNGEHLTLSGVTLDGKRLTESEYSYDGTILRLTTVPNQFELKIETVIAPDDNTALEGLYRSSGNYCTQCEAEGFRRITCYPDRPDVMSVFTTTVIGSQADCPVLLSNGNLLEEGVMKDGLHFATWHDPFPKPAYLFALVAGNLIRIEDSFTTMSGRKVALHFFVEERNKDKCDHAVQSLKKAMRWDEEEYGREYDLNTYMIVAVDDFNMGAMENKGLNVFNSKYVLARPETATDSDYEGIEGVIAHEYFHNWTGNRITCRDWFQLSLKEGLTVFRDQQFSGDMGSRAVKRINDANVMRSFQFREDSGPMAHPVRPASYIEINNFYTLTVYNKGAEVIRMLHTLLGRDGFRQGMDLYFERHDGQAVTCDDFVQAMQDGNGAESGIDLSQFKRWYSQAGTPELTVFTTYNADRKECVLTISQSCPKTADQGANAPEKNPFHIPIAIGLLDSRGRDITGSLLQLTEKDQEFSFKEIGKKPVVSLLRDFSAPVKIKSDTSDEELSFLMAHDNDPFNRWDAGQELGLKYLLAQISRFQKRKKVEVPKLFHDGFDGLLADEQTDPALLAAALTLPTETWISQQMEVIDPQAVALVRRQFRYQLSWEHRDLLFEKYYSLGTEEAYQYSPEEAGRRSLQNCCLFYLLVKEHGEAVDEELLQLGADQYYRADNMTDVSAALAAVVNADQDKGEELLADFYDKWQQDPLIVDKWLTLQACCTLPGTLGRVKQLMNHPAFSIKNPNKVRSLIGTFCGANQQQFHAQDGAGYVFLADQIIELDPVNPQIASRLLTPLTLFTRYDPQREKLMRAELERINDLASLSNGVGEIVEKSLESAGR